MTNPGRIPRGSSRSRLFSLLEAEFPDASQAYDLFDEFLRQQTYHQDFCLKLLATARGETGAPWEIRRLATLMLEHQTLKLHSNNPEDFDFLLTQLKLKQSSAIDQAIVSSVLREGFTTTEPRGFICELKRKLKRLGRVHDQIRGSRTSHHALREFVALSQSDCKLSLTRYLFRPEEVVDEILRHVRITDGVRDIDPSASRHVSEEMKCELDRLPDFEASILKRLCATGDIYWVAEKTSSEINSLVEYPLTTVVLAIKPPGSDLELEIKRAGRKGEHSLNVVYERRGYTVPPTHRLEGGSMRGLLRYEANHGSKLGAIYRLVHRTAAPMGVHVSRSTINSLPAQKGLARTLSYFTEPRLFGEGFRGMRIAMKESVAAFRHEGSAGVPEIPGELGLTAQFIGQVGPAQAIISGTSSLRLDKLATYLSPKGPESYFKKGLGIAYSKRAAKTFADTILEEVLGCYEPPAARYQNHDQYVSAALSVPGNRARADEVYLSLIRQIAKFWGTVLAVRAYSCGESFVARNVGLKSFWNDGRWDVKIIFMDHDALVIPNPRNGRFFAHGDVPNMRIDERYIWGRATPERFAASEVGCLQTIYRVGPALDEQGLQLARLELKAAYSKTQHELLTNPELQRLFSRDVVEHLRDWDLLVDGYLQMNGDKVAAGRWERKMKRMLAAKGYRKDMFAAYVEVMEKNREFLTENSFLFGSNGEKNTGRN